MQPVRYSNAHDLPTIETDPRLHLDALKAEASEQSDLMTARKARSLKENTHQPTPQVLSEHLLTIESRHRLNYTRCAGPRSHRLSGAVCP